MKKTLVLLVLFVLPIVAYLFFASGVNNFGKLPILTENVKDVSILDDTFSLKNKITVLGFLGRDVANKKGNVFNINQKIYKRFYEFNDFQFVIIVPKEGEAQVTALKKELGNLADTAKWFFIYADEHKIKEVFNGLKTDLSLDQGPVYPLCIHHR